MLKFHDVPQATRGLAIEGILKPDKVEQVLKGDTVDKCSLFALTLFYRWALRDVFIRSSSFELTVVNVSYLTRSFAESNLDCKHSMTV